MGLNFQAGPRFLPTTFFWYDIFWIFYHGHVEDSWRCVPTNFQVNVLSIKLDIVI